MSDEHLCAISRVCAANSERCAWSLRHICVASAYPGGQVGSPAITDGPETGKNTLLQVGAGTSLIHLDVRAPNLLVRDGTIRALIDWTNSMIGDPALELARIEHYAPHPENGIDLPELLRGSPAAAPGPAATGTRAADAGTVAGPAAGSHNSSYRHRTHYAAAWRGQFFW